MLLQVRTQVLNGDLRDSFAAGIPIWLARQGTSLALPPVFDGLHISTEGGFSYRKLKLHHLAETTNLSMFG